MYAHTHTHTLIDLKGSDTIVEFYFPSVLLITIVCNKEPS